MITTFFPRNSLVLSMDDDVSELYRVADNQTYPLDQIGFQNLCLSGFHELASRNLSLFGIHPSDSKHRVLQVKEKRTSKVQFIIGTFFGVRNDHSLLVCTDDKEDHHRSILHSIKCGAVFRFNDYGAVHDRNNQTPGDMTSCRTYETKAQAVAYLTRTYSFHCRPKPNQPDEMLVQQSRQHLIGPLPTYRKKISLTPLICVGYYVVRL